MWNELRVLLGLCLLRVGPQDVPFAPGLAWRWLLLSLTVDFLVYAQLLELPVAAPRLLLSAAVSLSVVAILLRSRQRDARLPQTLAAWFGCGALFTLVFSPIAWYALGLPPVDSPESVRGEQILVDLAWLALVSWNLMVNAHILRHALDLPMHLTIPMTIGLFIFNTGLDQWLFEVGKNS